MRKQIEVTHKYDETFCDVCAEQITTRYNRDGCLICGIDMCLTCQKSTGAEIESSGDGTAFKCVHCSSIFTIIYKKRLDKLSEQIDELNKQYENIYYDYIKTAIKHREQNESKTNLY